MERNDMGNGAEVGGVRPHCLDAALPYAKPRFSVILLGGFDGFAEFDYVEKAGDKRLRF